MQMVLALQYKAWADSRTLAAVEALGTEGASECFAFALQQLNHMLRVEELFRARLLGEPEPHDSTNSALLPALTELKQGLMTSNEWLQGYANGLSPEQMQVQIQFAFADGQRGAMSREEVLFHLINHGSYHRGAIGHALDRASAHRPADTYTVFVHQLEPERRLRR